MSVILHEVGKHIGIENILTPQQQQDLDNKIRKWAEQNDGSIESSVSKAALARATIAGRMEGKTDNREIVAYFIEEAVAHGVDPTAVKGNTSFAKTIRNLWAAFKRALRKVRMTNLDSLTAQDVVDLAYGAARLELGTQYHGANAAFRQFDHSYMGSGEGAQAFSWGTYLAEKFGIGDDYRQRDVDRKKRAQKFQLSDAGLQDKLGGKKVRVSGEPNFEYLVPRNAELTYSGGIIAATLRRTVQAPNKFAAVDVPLDSILDMDGTPSLANEDIVKAATTLFKKTKPSANRGNLYNVDTTIADNEWLDWDAPISEQPNVMEAIRQMPQDVKDAGRHSTPRLFAGRPYRAGSLRRCGGSKRQ